MPNTTLTTHDDLARQSLARELSPAERDLAAALMTVFATGQHDFTAVAAALNETHVLRPSGEPGIWTAKVLEEELLTINTSLDQAYLQRGIGA